MTRKALSTGKTYQTPTDEQARACWSLDEIAVGPLARANWGWPAGAVFDSLNQSYCKRTVDEVGPSTRNGVRE